MTQLTVDAAMLAKICTVTELTEVRDEAGQVLGFYYPLAVAQKASKVQSPFGREELELRRKEPAGRPLADILKDLGAK